MPDCVLFSEISITWARMTPDLNFKTKPNSQKVLVKVLNPKARSDQTVLNFQKCPHKDVVPRKVRHSRTDTRPFVWVGVKVCACSSGHSHVHIQFFLHSSSTHTKAHSLTYSILITHTHTHSRAAVYSKLLSHVCVCMCYQIELLVETGQPGYNTHTRGDDTGE